MEKNFRRWNSLKEELHKKEKIIYFRERDIWWCSLGLNIGFEEDGKNHKFERPVLIIKKFSKDLFWALPTTTQDKKGKYYYRFKNGRKECSIILSQIRAISSKRLLRKIRKFPPEDFEKVRDLIRNFL